MYKGLTLALQGVQVITNGDAILLRNDLLCVERDVKLYTLTPSLNSDAKVVGKMRI